jgi:hypothetical protein
MTTAKSTPKQELSRLDANPAARLNEKVCLQACGGDALSQVSDLAKLGYCNNTFIIPAVTKLLSF